jgi:hypothetical protein
MFTVAVRFRGWRGPSGQFASQAQRSLQGTLDRLGERALELAQEEAPVGEPGSGPPGYEPGALRGGIRLESHDAGATSYRRVRSTAAHTVFVVKGRRAFSAPPGRMLRWWSRGQPVFRQRVAAVKPNPFMARAYARWRPLVRPALRTQVATFQTLIRRSETE